MAQQFAQQFYHSREWERVRTYILIRDKYKCRKCGRADVQLEVHHIKHLTPDNINDASVTLNDKNLITLCRDCHFAEHAAEKQKAVASAHAKGSCSEKYYFDEHGFLQIRDGGV